MQKDSPVLMRKSGKILVSECGITSVRLIVGGVTAQPKEFPHMVSTYFSFKPTQSSLSIKTKSKVLLITGCVVKRNSLIVMFQYLTKLCKS